VLGICEFGNARDQINDHVPEVRPCCDGDDADRHLIVAFDGSRVIYVVERAGIYPIWNKAMWRAMPKADFAKELLGEIFAR